MPAGGPCSWPVSAACGTRSAFQDSASLEKRLEPGQYRLLLTANQSPGLVTLYVKDR
jgi:hypothetical protein